MNADGLELRPVGLHRRASAPIGALVTIGADPDCDIVLADDGIAARRADPPRRDGLDPDAGGRRRNGASRANPTRLGPVWLTLAATDAPWIEPPRRMRRRSKTRPSSIRPATRRTPPTHPPGRARPAARATGPEPVLPPRPAQEPRGAVRATPAWCDAALRVRHRHIIQPQPTWRPPTRCARPSRMLPAIRRVLEQQGLAERLTIGRRPDHSIIIRAGCTTRRAGTGGHGHGAGLAHAGAAPEQ